MRGHEACGGLDADSIMSSGGIEPQQHQPTLPMYPVSLELQPSPIAVPHLQAGCRDEPHIRGNAITRLHEDDVAWHDGGGVDGLQGEAVKFAECSTVSWT